MVDRKKKNRILKQGIDLLLDPIALFGKMIGMTLALLIFTIITAPIFKLINLLWAWAFAH